MAKNQELKSDLLPSHRDGKDNWRECPQFAHPIHAKVEIECYIIYDWINKIKFQNQK